MESMSLITDFTEQNIHFAWDICFLVNGNTVIDIASYYEVIEDADWEVDAYKASHMEVAYSRNMQELDR